MEPVRPQPVRPYATKRASELRDAASPGSLKQSKSHADIASLSRTSSFLSFAGLDQLKSSALFGIFEKGGLDTEPVTPDPHAQYDFHLSPTKTVRSTLSSTQTTSTASIGMTVTKLVGVAAASLAFILLFNQIPNNNRFCAISSSQAINPILYVFLATGIAFIYPLLERRLKDIVPTQKRISSPIEKDSAQNTAPRDEGDRAPHTSLPFSVLLRYFAGFLGLAYAGTKLDFSESSQFNLCVCAIALAVQLILDRTARGLILSIVLGLVVSAGWIVMMKPVQEEMAGVASLIWLNVSVYGSLGKVLKIWP